MTIPVSEASGNGKGKSPGDLQIDLNNLQTHAVLFNTGSVPVNTYQTVQVVIDTNYPGTIVPVCGGGSGLEGCINYPMALSSTTQTITLTLPSPGLTVSKDRLAQLLLNLNLQITASPTTSGGTYTVAPTISEVTPGNYLGLVTGNVQVSGTASGSPRNPLSVSAEVAGTSNVVSTAPLTNGTYTLSLPADASGTSYDLFVAGGGYDYDAIQNVTVMPGQTVTPPDMSVKAQSFGRITGTITDGCTGKPIQGATLELLAPPKSSSADCSTSPQSCVAVGTASTDETGSYPLPGTKSAQPAFSQVPTGNKGLALEISAPGYNNVLTSAQASSGSGTCTGTTNTKNCSLALQTSYITGNVQLTAAPPAGNSVQVQVLAEDSGTNNLVSSLPVPALIRGSQSSVPFTLNVPVGGTFDLFATAIDPYLGGPAPYTGHTIEVAPAITGPTTSCNTVNIANAIPALDCAGHGSASGTVSNPDVGTTVEVSKGGVQLFGTTPGLLESGINNAYTFCLPPGSYTFQREENGVPGAQTTATVAQPAATSTPCPSSCGTSSSCPGVCTASSSVPPL